MLVVFGEAQPVWARSQLQLARKLMAVRTKGPLPVALYEGPPPQTKDKLNYRLAHMEVLNCRSGLDQAELQRFIESLKGDGGA